jgi:hypothetical protein
MAVRHRAARYRSRRHRAIVARHGQTTADDDEPVLSHTAKLIIAVVVFALGVLAGAAIAAWVIPPS